MLSWRRLLEALGLLSNASDDISDTSGGIRGIHI